MAMGPQVRFSRAGIRAVAAAPPVEGKGNLITGIRVMRLRWNRKRLLAVRARNTQIPTAEYVRNIIWERQRRREIRITICLFSAATLALALVLLKIAGALQWP